MPARAHAAAAPPPVLRQPRPIACGPHCSDMAQAPACPLSSRPRTRRKMCASATTGGASPRLAPRKLPWRPPTPTPRLRLWKLGAPLPPVGFDIVRPPPETQSKPRSRRAPEHRGQGDAARARCEGSAAAAQSRGTGVPRHGSPHCRRARCIPTYARHGSPQCRRARCIPTHLLSPDPNWARANSAEILGHARKATRGEPERGATAQTTSRDALPVCLFEIL